MPEKVSAPKRRKTRSPSDLAGNAAESHAKVAFQSFGWSTEGFDGGKEPCHDGTVKVCENGAFTGEEFWVEVKHQDKLRLRHRDFVSQRVDVTCLTEWSEPRAPTFLVVFHVPERPPFEPRGGGMYLFVSGLSPERHNQTEIALRIPLQNVLDFPFASDRIRFMVANLWRNQKRTWDLSAAKRDFRRSGDRFGLAALLMATGDLLGAARTILKATGTGEREFLAYTVAGSIFLQNTKYQASEQAFDRARSCSAVSKEKMANVRHGLAVAWRKQGDLRRAKEVFLSALDDFPQRRDLWLYELGMIEHRLCNWQEAVRLLEDSAEAARNADKQLGSYIGITQAGAVYLDKGDRSKAEQYLKQALDHFRGRPKARPELGTRWFAHCWRYLAFLNAFEGKMDEATRCLQQFEPLNEQLGRDVNVPPEQWCQGIIRMIAGDAGGSAELITEGINQSEVKTGGAYVAEMLVWKGSALRKARRESLALMCFQKAARYSPTDSNAKGVAIAHYWLGKVFLERKGNVAKQKGLFHLAVARGLRGWLQFSDYSEIDERAAENIPPAINKKAERETIRVKKILRKLGDAFGTKA